MGVPLCQRRAYLSASSRLILTPSRSSSDPIVPLTAAISSVIAANSAAFSGAKTLAAVNERAEERSAGHAVRNPVILREHIAERVRERRAAGVYHKARIYRAFIEPLPQRIVDLAALGKLAKPVVYLRYAFFCIKVKHSAAFRGEKALDRMGKGVKRRRNRLFPRHSAGVAVVAERDRGVAIRPGYALFCPPFHRSSARRRPSPRCPCRP